MTKMTVFLTLAVILAATGVSRSAAEGINGAVSPVSVASQQNVQYVGTYEHFVTPMGGSSSVLMVNGDKIKIASVDRTRYVNVPMRTEYRGRPLTVPIPEILEMGTYRVKGAWKKNPFDVNKIFIVREMEYLGGGEGVANDRERRALPDFYQVDASRSGPLTLSELNIRFPASLERYFDDEALACFYRQVERRAVDMGDPLTMQAHKRVLLFTSRNAWEESSVAEKRLQMARYVTSMALGDC